MFLKQTDFSNLIAAEHLDQLLRGNPLSLDESMREAQSEIENYLRGKFDLTLIFKEYAEHNPGTTYLSGAFVWHNSQIYTTSQDVASGGATPPADPWSVSDPRHALIKQIYKDVTLYHLHSGISPRNIPELRVLRYKDAIKTLKMVKDGELHTDLPKIAEPDFSSPRVYSKTRESWMY